MGYKVTEAKYQTCICGKVCKGLSALQTHGRACPKSQVRRAAYIAAIELGNKPLSDAQVLANYDLVVSRLIELGNLPTDFNNHQKGKEMAIQKFAVGDRVSWAGAGCDGTVIELDETSPRLPTLVRVAWDHGGDSWFGSDSLYPADRQGVIEADTFTRLAEIDAYADRAGCDRAEAVRRLVNTALSHQELLAR